MVVDWKRFDKKDVAALGEALKSNSLWPYSGGANAPFMRAATAEVQAHFAAAGGIHQSRFPRGADDQGAAGRGH